MAKLAILSNKLNDIQLYNLKMFPFIYFDNISEVSMDYDLSNTMDVSTEEDSKSMDIAYEVINGSGSNLRVSYDLSIMSTDAIEHLDNRCAHLEASVRNLLWKEIKVKVSINGKNVFESKNG